MHSDNSIYKICICGGGSLGTVCAGVFLSKGYKVNLLTGHPLEWSKEISVTDPDGQQFNGVLNKISDKPEEVIPSVDLVLLCLPGYLIEKTLISIKPFLKDKTIVGSIVGSTGFFFKAHEILKEGQPLFAFQRVPFISRYNKYGVSANLLGYKKELNVAVENLDEEKAKKILENLFMTPINIVNSYLEVSLSNSNPILHTGRLYALWANKDITPLPEPIKFYADWDNESSEIVLGMDEEFMQLIDKLGLSSSSILSLKDYYEISDVNSFTKKIGNIEAFRNIVAPMIQTEDGWIPDFKSRYFTEDFPYGLKFIKDLANEKGIKTPVIDKIYSWGKNSIK